MEEGKFYHVYNRGNNRENLFYQERNYYYFLNLFEKHLSEYVELHAYCLMPNHFHLMLRVRDAIPLRDGISEYFRRMFISYSQAINKQENRIGSLFQKPFKRKVLDNETYFSALVAYIHYNPVKAGLARTYADWEHSSFNAYLGQPHTIQIECKTVLDWFRDLNGFINFHESYAELQSIGMPSL